jgi:hypothetical protein
MLPFCPNAIEDEWLPGFLSRWFRQSGFISWQKFLNASIGAHPPFVSESVVQICDLKVNYKLVKANRCVAKEMTILPFVLPLLGTNVLDRIELAFKKSSSCVVSVSNAEIGGGRNSRPRFCTACANEQLSSHGFAVWLRCHNIPGVTACWKHSCLLQHIPALNPKSRIPEVPLSDVNKVDMPQNGELIFARHVRAICLAQFGNIGIFQRAAPWNAAIATRIGHSPKPIFIKEWLLHKFGPHDRAIHLSTGLKSIALATKLAQGSRYGVDRSHSMNEAIWFAEALFDDGIIEFLNMAVSV